MSADDIPDGFALLQIDSTVEDAYVYIGSTPIGPVGQPNKVRCGAVFIRLGNKPLTRWYSEGKSVAAPCKQSVKATVVTRPGAGMTGKLPSTGRGFASPKPKPTGAPKGWTPDDL